MTLLAALPAAEGCSRHGGDALELTEFAIQRPAVDPEDTRCATAVPARVLKDGEDVLALELPQTPASLEGLVPRDVIGTPIRRFEVRIHC